MPLPPPPADALTSSGKPMSRPRDASAADVLVVAVVTGHGRHPGPLGADLGLALGAEQPDHQRAGPDEGHARLGARVREARVLRQEAVAGMDRVGAGQPRRRQDLVDHQVRLGGRRRSDPHRLVGELDERHPGVGVRVHRHRRDAHPPAGPHHPHRDLAAVGDQDLLDGPARRRRHRVVARSAHVSA
jgi:hypothetical protein